MVLELTNIHPIINILEISEIINLKDKVFFTFLMVKNLKEFLKTINLVMEPIFIKSGLIIKEPMMKKD